MKLASVSSESGHRRVEMAFTESAPVSSTGAGHLLVLLIPFAALEFFEADPLSLRCGWSIGSEQQRSLHGCSDGGADKAVEPVVIGLLGTGFPFVDRSAAAFGADVVLGRDLLGEETMRVGSVTEEG